MISVTDHARTRMHERCKVKLRSTDRLAQIAFDKGLTLSDVSGSLRGYIISLSEYNGQANNIRLYGDKIYIFCNDVLVTVYDTPRRFQPMINNLMRRKKEQCK